jgi:hypothetical protein
MNLSRTFAFAGPLLPCFCGLLTAVLTSAHAASGDQHWDNQFGPVGTSDQLWSAAVVQGKVYVGGVLLSAGNTAANYVAGYDGTNWFALNNGINGTFNITYVFTLAGDGTNLYAGGWFTNADNSGAAYLARWDGSRWWPLAGGNPNSIVEIVKIIGTNYFVGGLFTTNGAVAVNGIARWTGAGWQAFGSGVTGPSNPLVEAIEYDGTNLFVGGVFTQAGGVNATNVARWNGTSWSAMGSGFNGPITALARYGGYVYAGGNFTNGTLGITNLAKWDGAAWSAVGTGANQIVHDLLTDGTNLYAGGQFTLINDVAVDRIAEFDGASWQPLGVGIEGFGEGSGFGVYKMAFDANYTLYAAGNFNQAGGVGASHVAGWNGANWFALGATTSKGMTHFDGDVQALLDDGTNLYAGGLFTEAGSNIVDGVAEWDGTNWYALGIAEPGLIPGPFSPQGKAFTEAPGGLYVGGNFTGIGGTAARYIALWDGANWDNLGDADAIVHALAYDGTFVWVGGSFTNIGGGPSPGLAAYYYPGNTWYSFGSVAGGGAAVNALAVDDGNVYVGGNFTSVGGVSATNIAYWNGGGWVPLGNGVNNTVNAIAASNGVVYAGGTFTSASGTAVNRIAQWNGSSWSALASGVNSVGTTPSVSAILLHGTNVYVAGSFTNAGGVYAPGVAVWNGSSWSALGSGLYYNISGGSPNGHSLASSGNDIFVGGIFTFAGSKPSSFIARWNDELNFYPPPNLQLTRSVWLTNRQFQFRVAGTSGQNYTLLASTNLSTWTPLLTNSATLYDFTDTNASKFNRRFYRGVLGP